MKQDLDGLKSSQQRRRKDKLPSWVRLVSIIFVFIFFFIFFSAILLIQILSIWSFIPYTWFQTVTAISGTLGALFTFLAALPLYSPKATRSNGNNPAHDPFPNTPSSSTTEIPPVSPNKVFFFNLHLTDSREFFGRERERQKLIKRIHEGGSISIVGQRRIGKTWLIQYLELEGKSQLGPAFRIGYLDATRPSCKTVRGFTHSALEALHYIDPNPGTNDFNLIRLENVVKGMIERKYTPVLCIDEFEGLSGLSEFDLNFYSSLRAIALIGLRLVIISKRRPIDVVRSNINASSFFNIFEELSLQPFNIFEAEEFVKAKGMQARFSEQECNLLLKYGQDGGQQWPPLRLQLVGQMLLDDKQVSQYYDLNDRHYLQDFEERLEEQYQGTIGAH